LGTWTQTVENDAPTGSGFRKSLKTLCTTADASPAAGDLMFIRQKLEGQNLQSIKKGTSSASQISLTFWVKSNVTGTYVFELYDVDNARHICRTYTINSSATWEKKTIVLPSDTSGAFDNDNNESLNVNFWLGAGSTYTSGSLSTSWGSFANANRAVGQTNVAAATNNYWQITGVQLEANPVATDFEFRPIGVELQLCQRYYQVYGLKNQTGLVNMVQYSSTEIYGAFFLPVPMRAAPTADITNATNAFTKYANSAATNFSTFSVIAAGTTPEIVEMAATVSGTAGHACWIRANAATTKLGFTAEL
jgi:hypothetical protein